MVSREESAPESPRFTFSVGKMLVALDRLPVVRFTRPMTRPLLCAFTAKNQVLSGSRSARQTAKNGPVACRMGRAKSCASTRPTSASC